MRRVVSNGVTSMLFCLLAWILHAGLLCACAAFVLFCEAINGFHDTANAVTTVSIPPCVLSPVVAAVFNFLGVCWVVGACAVVHMLPTDLLLNMGSSRWPLP